MSRLEAVARQLFYPTPPGVVALISRHLRAPETAGRKAVRMLDPCAGTGDALAELGRALCGETFGIELNDERARAARAALAHALHGSAFGCRLAHGAFSLLLLNPPYDEDSAERRLEHHFLTAFTRALCPGGVLCYVVPQPRLALSARFLCNQYEELDLCRFPDPDYGDFRQVVLFGRRRSAAQADPAAQAFLEQIAGQGPGALEPLAADAEVVYELPALPRGEVLFASQHFDAAQAEVEAARRGLLAKGPLAEQLWPPEEIRVRPLVPLKKAHRALLMASGLLDNVVLEGPDGRRAIVKGRTVKELVRVSSDSPRHEVHREMVRTNITLLDLATGRVARVENGPARRRDEPRGGDDGKGS